MTTSIVTHADELSAILTVDDPTNGLWRLVDCDRPNYYTRERKGVNYNQNKEIGGDLYGRFLESLHRNPRDPAAAADHGCRLRLG